MKLRMLGFAMAMAPSVPAALGVTNTSSAARLSMLLGIVIFFVDLASNARRTSSSGELERVEQPEDLPADDEVDRGCDQTDFEADLAGDEAADGEG